MSGIAVSEKTLRIALMLRDAAVLDEKSWQMLAKRAGIKTEKGAWEILNQEVSLKTWGELFSMDVFAMLPGKTLAELERNLGQAVRIFPEEVAFLLRVHQPDVARLCRLFIQANLMSTESLEKALDRAERDALNVYDVLVGSELVTPESIEKLAATRQSAVSLDNRLLFAGDILTFNNLIVKEDYERALKECAESKTPMWRTLATLNLLSQEELEGALEEGLELPLVELLAFDLSPRLLDMFPQDLMRRQMFLPLSAEPGHLEIATTDPFNTNLADTLALLTGRHVSVVYAAHNDMLVKFERHFTSAPVGSDGGVTSMPERAPRRPPKLTESQKMPAVPPATDGDGKAPGGDSASRVPERERAPKTKPEPFVDNMSAVQLVTQIIEGAVAANATDIHVEPAPDTIGVRYRVDGTLHRVMTAPVSLLPSITSRMKVLANMNVTERRRPQDGHFSFDTKAGNYDFRVSTLPSAHGEKLVLRVLDSTRVMTGVDQLGFEPQQMEAFQRIILRPHGLVLVTGPTGSGKTSTLYAALSALDRNKVNIITIEDPIEYQLEGITQVQVDSNVDLTFAGGLRSALRQDPDVIMVGEIRDSDTATVAIRAALTGHLVFATLHTNSAVGAVSSLVHMGVPRYMVASALAGIIAQRLVKRVCQGCAQPDQVPKALLKELGLGERSRKKFQRGAGCSKCLHTGFKGRTGVFEVIEVTAKFRQAILTEVSEEELAAIVRERSMGLLDAGSHKAQAGDTTVEEVLRAVSYQ